MPIGWPDLGFDLLQEVDCIGLEDRHVGIGVESMEAAGGMPGRARGQDRALHQRHVAPAIFCQMVKDRSPDHAPADNNDAVVRFHLRALLTEAPVHACYRIVRRASRQ